MSIDIYSPRVMIPAFRAIKTPREIKAIAEAQAARVFEPLFKTKPEGMSDEEWKDYQNLGEQATVDAIVAKARTKYPLSEEQEKAIRAPITAAPPANVEDATVKVTYATVASQLNAAQDADALGAAADLIKQVADEGQRKELDAIFTRRSAELTTD